MWLQAPHTHWIISTHTHILAVLLQRRFGFSANQILLLRSDCEPRRRRRMALPVVVDGDYLKEVDKARRDLRALIANRNCAPLMLRLAYSLNLNFNLSQFHSSKQLLFILRFSVSWINSRSTLRSRNLVLNFCGLIDWIPIDAGGTMLALTMPGRRPVDLTVPSGTRKSFLMALTTDWRKLLISAVCSLLIHSFSFLCA